MQTPEDEPCQLEAWTRRDVARLRMVRFGCLLQAAVSLSRWGYLFEETGERTSILIGLYWVRFILA